MTSPHPAADMALNAAQKLLLPRCARVLVSGTSEGDWVVKNGTAHRFLEKPWRKGAVLAALGEVVG